MHIEPCMWCTYQEPFVLETMVDRFYVTCSVCGATGPEKDTEQEAVDAWNEVARIVREVQSQKYNKPSFAVEEISSYKGFVYSIIEDLDNDCYFLKVDGFLYDKEYKSFYDAYEGLEKLIDILIKDKKE